MILNQIDNITFDRDGRTLSFDLKNGTWTEMHPETSPDCQMWPRSGL